MEQKYVWVVSWVDGIQESWRYTPETHYKVFTSKLNALNFKYQLENEHRWRDIRLEKRYN